MTFINLIQIVWTHVSEPHSHQEKWPINTTVNLGWNERHYFAFSQERRVLQNLLVDCFHFSSCLRNNLYNSLCSVWMMTMSFCIMLKDDLFWTQEIWLYPSIQIANKQSHFLYFSSCLVILLKIFLMSSQTLTYLGEGYFHIKTATEMFSVFAKSSETFRWSFLDKQKRKVKEKMFAS